MSKSTITSVISEVSRHSANIHEWRKIPNQIPFMWKPESLEEINGKAHHYKTCCISSSRECVKVLAYTPAPGGNFQVEGHWGIQWYNWRELDNFCL